MKEIQLSINGKKVKVDKGSTVLDAIRKADIYIPTLCHDPSLEPYGACRLCIVQIMGMRGLPTSCTTPAQEGMVVLTETEEIQRVRRTIIELALCNHPDDCLYCNKSQECELLKIANYLNIQKDALKDMRPGKKEYPLDISNPAFNFDPAKCILCGKCVRTCNEITGVGAIDFAHRGFNTTVSTFGSRPLVQSICQSCGECVARCPTGALVNKDVYPYQKEVKSVCPYCGVGCPVILDVNNQRIVRVRGDETAEVNHGELCVKGRYGFDFISHPDRLLKPLIRKKNISEEITLSKPLDAFCEAEWDEALDLVAQKFSDTVDRDGPDAIGVLSSAKSTNEANYILQKFARAALGTNNVDHCARLCHASTVAAALASFGDGAMSNSISDIDKAEVMLVIGSNTTECHPIIGRKIKRAIKERGAHLIVADPRNIELTKIADIHLSHLPGTDVALINGIMRQIVKDDLHDKTFISERCEGYEPFLESLEQYDLETVEITTGVSRKKIQKSARLFAGRNKKAIVMYGMGITQHTTGTDNVKAIANLLMLTGNLGSRGTGFSPLRGQNNVQGACDMGALPTVYPGYQRLDDYTVKDNFEKSWGRHLSEKAGLTATDMFQAAHEQKLKNLYVMGENPAMSEPDSDHARKALAKLDFLVVQDLFLTETAQLADVVLPAAGFAEKDGTFTNTERRVQLLRKAVDPPGKARPDWEIIMDISNRMGYPMNYSSSAEIMSEIASLVPIYGGIYHERLYEKGLQWPCWNREHGGTQILHEGNFTRGKGLFHVVHDTPPAELPTQSYPLLLTTGRILEHWHTGSMSRRSRILSTLVPESRVEINPVDADQLGIKDGDTVSLSSRRGKVQTKAKKSERVNPGQAFMAFHWGEAPVNRLTNPVFDPIARIPEYKVSSIRAILTILEKAAEDNKFLAALAENPAGVLDSYDLTPEHRKALVLQDILSLEKWVGPLDERLHTWLKTRLKQERI